MYSMGYIQNETKLNLFDPRIVLTALMTDVQRRQKTMLGKKRIESISQKSRPKFMNNRKLRGR